MSIQAFCSKTLRLSYKISRKLQSVISSPDLSHRPPYTRSYEGIWRTAATDVGLQFVPLSATVWEIRDDSRLITRVSIDKTMLDNPVTLAMAGDKILTYDLLSKIGVAIPRNQEFTLDSLELLRQFVGENEGPFVVKPAKSTSAACGVTTHLYTYAQCLRAAALAAGHCEDLLVERFVAGESYRLLFVGQKMVHASRRTGIRVKGNGHQSLTSLMMDNQNGRVAATAGARRKIEEDFSLTVLAQGITPEFVPDPDEYVLVLSTPSQSESRREFRTVYTEDVTSSLSVHIIEEAERACIAIGSDFCGVDVITTNSAVALAQSGGVIGEVNTTPALLHHYQLQVHNGRPAAKPAANSVLEYFLEKSR